MFNFIKTIKGFYNWRRERKQEGYILFTQLSEFIANYNFDGLKRVEEEKDLINKLLVTYKGEYDKPYSDLKYSLAEELTNRIAINNASYLKNIDNMVLKYYEEKGRDLLADVNFCYAWLKTSKYYAGFNMRLDRLAECLSISTIYKSIDDILK